ncbi:MAG: hypothetical protein HOI25_04415 [Proteobacteria bacterium]|nr:hypothetical protein [Pseudomonadota bacterium]
MTGDENSSHEAEDGGAVPIADGGPAMAAFNADGFVFIEDDSTVDTDVGVGLVGGDGVDGFRFGLSIFGRGGSERIGLHAAAAGGHYATATATGFHWGRGVGSNGLGGGEFRLVQLGALAAMRARNSGTLKIGRVFQMLAAGLAGAFMHAGGTHLPGH